MQQQMHLQEQHRLQEQQRLLQEQQQGLFVHLNCNIQIILTCNKKMQMQRNKHAKMYLHLKLFLRSILQEDRMCMLVGFKINYSTF
jgi:hypothetical protein